MSIYIITGKTGHGKTAYMAKWARILLRRKERIFSNIKFNPVAMGLLQADKDKVNMRPDKDKVNMQLTPLEGYLDRKADREDPNKKILYWQNFSEWEWMTDGTVFCDEGLVYFNARKWESLPDTMQMKFVQHRKDKVDLVLNVQHYTFIEKTLRVLCERFINCDLKFGSAKFDRSRMPRIAKVTEFELPVLNRAENMGIDVYNMTREDSARLGISPLWSEWFWIRRRIFGWYDTSVKLMESKPEPLKHLSRSCPECGFEKVSHS